MYKRFKWNPEIRFENPRMKLNIPPSRIFVGSTMELFGTWIKAEWLRALFGAISLWPQHTFIFLTKQPQNLPAWSPFPSNCHVGVSVVSNGGMTLAMTHLANIKAPVRFISFEPLLGAIGMNDHMSIKEVVDWLIIGSQTQPVRHPPKEWVTEIIEAADKAEIPVFVKEPLASFMNIHRQEYPR